MLLRPCFASNLRVMMRRRWEIHMAAHDKEGEEPKEAISAHSWKTRKADVLDATMSYNEAYEMFETWCGPSRTALCLRCYACQCAEGCVATGVQSHEGRRLQCPAVRQGMGGDHLRH